MAHNKKYKVPVYELDIKDKTTPEYVTAAREYGDLMHIFPSNGSYNIDEICNLVWTYERNHPEKSQQRTRKQIEEGITELLQANILNLTNS